MRRVSLAWGVASAIIAMAGIAYAYLVSRPRDDPDRELTFNVGARRLTIAASYLNAVARPTDPPELVATFPGFKPAGRFIDISAQTDLDDRFRRLVFLTIRPADPALDPADRTARLYERFLAPIADDSPDGLVARAFEKGSPFEGDELVYTPPEGREFAARCPRLEAAHKTPETCSYIFRSAELDVEIRFSAALLADWRGLSAGARGLVDAARR